MSEPEPLTMPEVERLDCPEAYARAVELGYVANYFEYRSALRRAKLAAAGETFRTKYAGR